MKLHDDIREMAAAGGLKREIEAVIGRKLTTLERSVFDSARIRAKLDAVRERAARRPSSSADRVAAHVARRNEIGQIRRRRHPRLVEACRYNLELFGWMFCRELLDHRASDEIDRRLIKKIEQAVLHGGQLAVEFTRGAGKTTWTIIAFIWAIVYGHRHFPVCIAASRNLAKSIKKSVLSMLETSDALLADFPAVPTALRAIGGVVQRAQTITYNGRPVNFESSDLMFRLPMLMDEDGKPLEPACGALFACRGVGASVRGINEKGDRPDFILFDDPQTQKDASSATAVERLDRYIHGDALNLGSNTSTMAAFLTITPQRLGDLAHRIADRNLHPNWSITKCPFLIELCPDFEKLVDQFLEAYNTDAANDDFLRSTSRAWYLANREKFAGTRCVDPLAFDDENEVDAIHHALNKIGQIGKEAFAAEYQMQVAPPDAGAPLTPETVCNALTGFPEWTLPPGTSSAVAFVDVNIQKGTGLSYVVGGFGAGRVVSYIAYGRYPEKGSLVPPGSTDLAKTRAVASAIRAVVAKLASADIRTADGRHVRIRAVGFDRGYMPAAVCRTLYVLRKRQALPFQLCAVRGFGWRQFGGARKDLVERGDHVFATRSEYGEYLAVHAPYWHEISMSGFGETPLMPGSISVWGDNPLQHWEFANEICSERLIRKYVHPSGKLAWDFSPPMGPNHFGDAGTGMFALASWFRLYDALPKVLDAAAAGKLPPADLFDPIQNPAVAENASAAPGVRPPDGLKTLEEWRAEQAAAAEQAAGPRIQLPKARVVVKKKGGIRWRRV